MKVNFELLSIDNKFGKNISVRVLKLTLIFVLTFIFGVLFSQKVSAGSFWANGQGVSCSTSGATGSVQYVCTINASGNFSEYGTTRKQVWVAAYLEPDSNHDMSHIHVYTYSDSGFSSNKTKIYDSANSPGTSVYLRLAFKGPGSAANYDLSKYTSITGLNSETICNSSSACVQGKAIWWHGAGTDDDRDGTSNAFENRYYAMCAYDDGSGLFNLANTDCFYFELKLGDAAKKANVNYFRITGVNKSGSTKTVEKGSGNGGTYYYSYSFEAGKLTYYIADDNCNAVFSYDIEISYNNGTFFEVASSVYQGTYTAALPHYSSYTPNSYSTLSVRLILRYYDGTGYPFLVTVYKDTSAPSITNMSISNSSGGNWTNQTVKITGSGATDSGSGMDAYYYSTSSSGTYTTFGSDNEVSFSSARNDTLYIKACDVLGNCSSTKTTYVKIDTTKPTVTSFAVSNPSGGVWVNTSVTIKASGATDGGTYKSGITMYRYSTDSGTTWISFSTISTGDSGYGQHTWSTDINITLVFSVCDAAGNCSFYKNGSTYVTTNVKIDKTLSLTGITFTKSDTSAWASQWANTDMTVRISGVKDSGSGVDYYFWRTLEQTSGTRNKFTTSVGGDSGYGQQTWTEEQPINWYTFGVCDVAGNCKESANGTSFGIDKTKPVITSFDLKGNSLAEIGYTNSTYVSVLLTTSDYSSSNPSKSGSGVSRYKIDEGSTEIKSLTSSKPSFVYLANSNNGTHTVTMTIYDSAGNMADPVTASIFLDQIAPTINIDIINDDSWSKTKNVVVTAVDEGGSELNSLPPYFYYYLDTDSDGVGNQVFEPVDYELVSANGNKAEFTITSLTGRYYLFVGGLGLFTDKAGNEWERNASFVTEYLTVSGSYSNPGITNDLRMDGSGMFRSVIYARSEFEYDLSDFLTRTNAYPVNYTVVNVTSNRGELMQLYDAGAYEFYPVSHNEPIVKVEYEFNSSDYVHFTFPVYYGSSFESMYYYSSLYDYLYDIHEGVQNTYGYGSFARVIEVKTMNANVCGVWAYDMISGANDMCLNGGDFSALVEFRIPYNEYYNYSLYLPYAGIFVDLDRARNFFYYSSMPMDPFYDRYVNTMDFIQILSFYADGYSQEHVDSYCMDWGYPACSLASTDYTEVRYTWLSPLSKVYSYDGTFTVLERIQNVSNYYKLTAIVSLDCPKYDYIEVYIDDTGISTVDDMSNEIDGYCSFYGIEGCQLESGISERSYVGGVYYYDTYTPLNEEADLYYLWKLKIRYPLYGGEVYDVADTTYYERSNEALFDNSAPSGTWSITNSSKGNLTNQNVTIKASGLKDNHSGVNKYYYSLGDEFVEFTTNVAGNSGYGQQVFSQEMDVEVEFKVCDAVGNCTTYNGSSFVRIDKTQPEVDIKIDQDANTATISVSDNKLISADNSHLGNEIEYYISINDNIDVSALSASQWIKPADDTERGKGESTMYVGKGVQYLYIKIPSDVADMAGNSVKDIYSSDISGYVVIKQPITSGSDHSINPDNISEKLSDNARLSNNYIVQVDENLIIVTFDSEAAVDFSMDTINIVLSKAGYRLISVNDSDSYDFESSYLYVTVVSEDEENNKSTENDIYGLMVLINAPVVEAGNDGAVKVFNEGDELGNLAVSFTSDIEFTVDTLITLDGARVDKVDTNKPGVYEIKYTATDAIGRVNKVYRSVIVNKNEDVVLVDEIIEEVEVQEAFIIETMPIETRVTTSNSKKVVEAQQVEMRIENKEEVKGYKKKERKNKLKKDTKGMLKLLSK